MIAPGLAAPATPQEFAQATDSQDAVFYFEQGLSHYEVKQYPQVIADYTKAITLNPKFADAYYNRGLIVHCYVDAAIL